MGEVAAAAAVSLAIPNEPHPTIHTQKTTRFTEKDSTSRNVIEELGRQLKDKDDLVARLSERISSLQIAGRQDETKQSQLYTSNMGSKTEIRNQIKEFTGKTVREMEKERAKLLRRCLVAESMIENKP